jgi:hypothetical protein
MSVCVCVCVCACLSRCVVVVVVVCMYMCVRDAGVVQGALRAKQQASTWRVVDRSDVWDPVLSSWSVCSSCLDVRGKAHGVCGRVRVRAATWRACWAAGRGAVACAPAGVGPSPWWAQPPAAPAPMTPPGWVVAVVGADLEVLRTLAAALGVAGAYVDAPATPICDPTRPWTWCVLWRALSQAALSCVSLTHIHIHTVSLSLSLSLSLRAGGRVRAAHSQPRRYPMGAWPSRSHLALKEDLARLGSRALAPPLRLLHRPRCNATTLAAAAAEAGVRLHLVVAVDRPAAVVARADAWQPGTGRAALAAWVRAMYAAVQACVHVPCTWVRVPDRASSGADAWVDMLVRMLRAVEVAVRAADVPAAMSASTLVQQQLEGPRAVYPSRPLLLPSRARLLRVAEGVGLPAYAEQSPVVTDASEGLYHALQRLSV